MKDGKIAIRYAKALFEFSIEQNILENAYQDMSLILKVCQENRNFRRLLINPIIKTHKKNEVISEIFKGKIHEITLSFMVIIIRKRRDIYIDLIAEQFINLYKEHKNIKVVHLQTAIEIDESLRKQIIGILEVETKSEIELIEEVKEELIGGFILKVNDQQFDSSISNRISKLSREFEGNIYAKGF
ncbi:MAG: ATP synthase F1 subunit delta [Saprospiraceae bacterium]|nr:ATP synthase F1 subunit delta [Saprospiraceae bacterium]